MSKKTALYDCHTGATMVPFAGWEMPIHYGSQIDEHHAVRRGAGMFDVSHMTVVDVEGEGAEAFLRTLLANDVAKLTAIGKALYTCMLNDAGGVIDDLIVYTLSPTFFRLVVNAATRDKDLAWLKKQAGDFDVTLTEKTELAMIAIQGPEAREKTLSVLSEVQRTASGTLKPFNAAHVGEWLIANTGYTGESGFEIILPNSDAPTLWKALEAVDVTPCGLGARDTLRLEAGLNLYGQDMDETISPLEANLAWTVAFEPSDRQFIGRAALEKQRDAGIARELVGLVFAGRGVPRRGARVIVEGEGIVTSGTFSPTLKKGIALALIPKTTATTCQVEMRDKLFDAYIVKPVFVRKGEATPTIAAL